MNPNTHHDYIPTTHPLARLIADADIVLTEAVLRCRAVHKDPSPVRLLQANIDRIVDACLNEECIPEDADTRIRAVLEAVERIHKDAPARKLRIETDRMKEIAKARRTA